MARIDRLFPTLVYRATLSGKSVARLNRDLKIACLSVARDDHAGQAWCRENLYAGYTSYASLNDLPQRAPQFQDLLDALAPHIGEFANALHFDLGKRKLSPDSVWINILKPGGVHTGHIHPHSVISGTYYVTVPKGSSPLKLEDPRLQMMMAAPPRKTRAPGELQPFISLDVAAGSLILFESWLRHEVPANQSGEDRISISFNYA